MSPSRRPSAMSVSMPGTSTSIFLNPAERMKSRQRSRVAALMGSSIQACRPKPLAAALGSRMIFSAVSRRCSVRGQCWTETARTPPVLPTSVVKYSTSRSAEVLVVG
eukprot:3737127-Prymnesium_polylepis.1